MAADGSSVCLGEHEVLAYVHGAPDDVERSRVELHIDVCGECRWLVSELAREDPLALMSSKIGRFVIRERLGAGGMGVVYSAYDPELDRNVALKLVRPGAHEDGPARLLAEARAMARLSHPGVVPIYDVTSDGAEVVLAMELVDGEDARRWLARLRPSWKTAIAVLLPAGRGLAAAHAAGIVHRDVKPSNVLIGRDGRARITDFGLARASSVEDATDQPHQVAESRPTVPPPVTRTGQLVGTPAYMAPEQRRGRSATARSDQFSFSVLLYEAVYGERPFATSDGEAALAASRPVDATAWRLRSAPAGSAVPAWLRRILLRGLAFEPAERWPSLAVMLHCIEDTPRRRRRVGLAAAAGATALAVLGVLVADHELVAANDCSGAPPALEKAFPLVNWTATRARIATLGPYGQVVANHVDQALGGFRSQWIEGHRDACLAHQSGAQSSALLDQRMACLGRARASLAAVGDLLRDATGTELPDVLAAVRSLPEPSACSDITMLLASVPPPPRELVDRVAAADESLAQIELKLNAGQFTKARDEARSIVALARSLGYRPLLARARLMEGEAGLWLDYPALAAEALAEATNVALEVGDDALAVEAWARGAYVKGTGGLGEAQTLDGVQLIESVARRLGSPSFARALLENNLAAAEGAHGHPEAAADRRGRVLALAPKITGPHARELLAFRGNVARHIEDPVGRDAALAEVESETSRWLGAEHPETLRQRALRGKLVIDLVAARQLLSSACEKYEQFHVAAAAMNTTECWAELGFVSDELDDRAGALAALEHVARLSGDGGYISPESPGYVLLFRGDARAASAHFRTAVAEITRSGDTQWWRTFERGKLELGLGRALFAAGDHRGASDVLQQALTDLSVPQAPGGVVHRRLARAYAVRAQALAATGSRTQAVDAAREALRWLREEGARSEELAKLSRETGARDGHGGLAERP